MLHFKQKTGVRVVASTIRPTVWSGRSGLQRLLSYDLINGFHVFDSTSTDPKAGSAVIASIEANDLHVPPQDDNFLSFQSVEFKSRRTVG